jgi:hypothetical protein
VRHAAVPALIYPPHWHPAPGYQYLLTGTVAGQSTSGRKEGSNIRFLVQGSSLPTTPSLHYTTLGTTYLPSTVPRYVRTRCAPGRYASSFYRPKAKKGLVIRKKCPSLTPRALIRCRIAFESLAP